MGATEIDLIDDETDWEPVTFAFSASDLSQALGSEIHLPTTFRKWEAMEEGPLKSAIFDAMKTQVESLQGMECWQLEELPDGLKYLPGKWVYDKKVTADGRLDRVRARWVVCGNFQDKDSKTVYAAVANLIALRVFLLIVALKDLELHQVDVVTAFLNALVGDHDIFVAQPYGFDDRSGRFCRLKRALYGLRESPLLWHKQIVAVLKQSGFNPLPKEPCILINEDSVMILLYVDDMLIAAPNIEQVNNFKNNLRNFFQIKDLGEAQQFLGFEIIRHRKTRRLWISQAKYINNMLMEKGITGYNQVPCPPGDAWPPEITEQHKTPAEMYEYQSDLGKLWWIANGTRPDIATPTGRAARDQQHASEKHDKLLRSIQRYLCGSQQLALCLGGPGYSIDDLKLSAFCDASWSDCKRTGKSTAGYVVMCGGAPIAWKSALQSFVATSTYEAEWTNLMPGGKALLYIADLFKGMNVSVQLPLQVYTDSMNALNDCLSGKWSPKLRHVKIKHRWIIDNASNGDFKIDYVPTHEMVADGLTKPLVAEKHRDFVRMLGLSKPPTTDDKSQSRDDILGLNLN
ncbi:hypothetical protein CGLO_18321 [Colletotrichum gloeosporioides Cg-14]|uniref:Reverse transcriptase Ty1/copia-type domain-containing protein n=1 Tax=Colletotrichum gloeosporioides (strain Cg-14) TaxID=1237896 RepID=T0JUS0_COLGC|nr:hypothetical protein CGLO_18321 [Colletotrichum gloeosporioides Cg-14]